MSEAKELDHPCRDTCSGWAQGYERGLEAAETKIGKLEHVLSSTRIESENRRVELLEMTKAIQKALAHCGHPDAAEGCRLVIKTLRGFAKDG